jgi:hypothetical protein
VISCGISVVCKFHHHVQYITEKGANANSSLDLALEAMFTHLHTLLAACMFCCSLLSLSSLCYTLYSVLLLFIDIHHQVQTQPLRAHKPAKTCKQHSAIVCANAEYNAYISEIILRIQAAWYALLLRRVATMMTALLLVVTVVQYTATTHCSPQTHCTTACKAKCVAQAHNSLLLIRRTWLLP